MNYGRDLHEKDAEREEKAVRVHVVTLHFLIA